MVLDQLIVLMNWNWRDMHVWREVSGIPPHSDEKNWGSFWLFKNYLSTNILWHPLYILIINEKAFLCDIKLIWTSNIKQVTARSPFCKMNLQCKICLTLHCFHLIKSALVFFLFFLWFLQTAAKNITNWNWGIMNKNYIDKHHGIQKPATIFQVETA